MRKHYLFFCSVAVLIALFSSCSKKNDSGVVTNIKLNADKAILAVGGDYQLTATILPENAMNKTIAWTSSNPAVATVDQNGKVVGVANGTATITAKAGNVTATCTVTVNVNLIAVTDIKLDTTNLALGIGQVYQLKATISPNSATNKIIAWTSSNTGVATVDTGGKITSVAPGTTVITATTQNGGKTVSCNVTVNETTTIALAVVSSTSQNIVVSSEGTVFVDWGDATKDSLSGAASDHVFQHYYGDASVQYTIKIMTPKLTKLVYSSGRNWATLDVSQNKHLAYLNVDWAQLTSLDLRLNTELAYLSAMYMSKLSSVNITGLTKLAELHLAGGFDGTTQLITSVDLSSNTSLTNLEIRQSGIVNLDLTKATGLTDFNAGDNALLETINAKNLTNLTEITADNTPNIKSIDLSGCAVLTRAIVGGISSWAPSNNLATLNLNGCTSLNFLTCAYTGLTSLDISACTSLGTLNARYNQLSSLKIASNQAALFMLKISSNQFTQAGLESLFGALPDVTSGSGSAQLLIANNPGTGAATFDSTALANKGWIVDKTSTF